MQTYRQDEFIEQGYHDAPFPCLAREVLTFSPSAATISGFRPPKVLTGEQSDFLAYRNHAGLYADFHSCRHFFITSLERAGVSPKMAQTLARHSDIRLTLGVYAHVELKDQTAAIKALGGPLESEGDSGESPRKP